ncbi:MAG: hypothetical protein ACRD10_03820 [Terriglobia bacterium]
MKWIGAAACILFYLAFGAVLFLSPWTAFWSQNFFFSRHASLLAIGNNYFLRGAISGLGLANIWMAFDAIHRIGHSSEAAIHTVK